MTRHADWHDPSIDIMPDFMRANAAGKAMLFPCRLLTMTFGFKMQAGHPSSERDQIQAGAVREGGMVSKLQEHARMSKFTVVLAVISLMSGCATYKPTSPAWIACDGARCDELWSRA